MHSIPKIDWSHAALEASEHLRTYLRYDTTNPPGNEEPAARFLHELLVQYGLDSKVIVSAPGRANVLARLGGDGSARPLILMSHIDVVGANPATWSVPPFAGEVRDGYLYGRGALDMKGMGILNLMVLVLLKRLGIRLKRDVIFLAVAG